MVVTAIVDPKLCGNPLLCAFTYAAAVTDTSPVGNRIRLRMGIVCINYGLQVDRETGFASRSDKNLAVGSRCLKAQNAQDRPM